MWLKHGGELNTMWLVGQYKQGEFPNIVWEFVGIFTTKDAALGACPDLEYFIAEVEVNKAAAHKSAQFPTVWYPNAPEDEALNAD